jgi:predicted transcriptional regulator
MKTYTVKLSDYLADFYGKIAENVDLPVEQVLADALFKLAGEMSREALLSRRGTDSTS